jgi:cell division protein FtsQ
LRAARRSFTAASWRYRIGVVAVVAGTVVAGYFLWLRDSSLVAVTNVDVVGVTSGDPARIRADLTQVAEGQTTLHVDAAEIEKAAAAYPTIESVSVDPNFPHGMRIEVNERPPAMLVEADGDQVAAAGDGTLLTGVEVSDPDRLPVLEVGHLPSGTTLEGDPLQQALVLGAAPAPLRPLIETVRTDDEYGVEVVLRGGIPVRFGSGSRSEEKWAAAAAVLADPKLDSLTYLDVRVPERPAAGGAAQA